MRRTQTLAANGAKTGSALADLIANLMGLVAAVGLNIGLTKILSAMAARGFRPTDLVLTEITVAAVLAILLGLAWWGLPRHASAIASWMCLSAGMRLIWVSYTFMASYASASVG